MWTLRIVDDESNQTIVKLVRDEYTVGRAEDNIVRLTERNISRHHAKLTRSPLGWNFVDLASSNGSFINGKLIERSQVVGHGDSIRVGDYHVEIRDAAREHELDGGITLPGVARSEAPSADSDRLVIVEGPGVGANFPLLRDQMILGRGEECDITLNDTSVSRVHAVLEKNEQGVKVSDRGSSNGIRVNGREFDSTPLKAGDIVELGDVHLRYVPAGVSSWPPGTAVDSMSASAPESLQFRGAGKKTYVVYAAAGLLAGLAAILLLRSGEAPDESAAADVRQGIEESEATAILKEAKRLLAESDLVGAHRKANELKEDSNLRQTADFREIERRWAELLLSLAENEPNVDRKRQILHQVAKAGGVDKEMRKRANDELSKLDAAGVEVTELPFIEEAAKVPPPEPAAEEPAEPIAAAPTPPAERPKAAAPQPANTPASHRPINEDTLASTNKAKPEAPSAAPKSAPSKAAASRPTKDKPTIIRDAPF